MVHKLKTYDDPVMDREFQQLYRRINQPLWDDVNFSAGNLKQGVTAPSWSAITGGLYGYVFEDAKVQSLHGCEEIPHGYKRDGNISPHIHWSPMTTNTGVVRWGMEYSWTNINATSTGTTTIYTEQASSGIVGKHQIISFPEIVGAGKHYGSYFCMRVFRDGTHANDTFTGGAFVPQVGIHFQADAAGSEQIMSKNAI